MNENNNASHNADAWQEERQAMQRYQRQGAILIPLGVMLYILSVIPLILLQNVTGLILMLVLVAIATGMMVYHGVSRPRNWQPCIADNPSQAGTFGQGISNNPANDAARQTFRAIESALWCLVTAVYFLVSFTTSHWEITWVIFLIGAALSGIAKSVFDLRAIPTAQKDESTSGRDDQ